MNYSSSTNQAFLAKLESWLRDRSEVLVLIRYANAAGSKDFELFTLCDLPARSSIIAFRQPQLPVRGLVDENFIQRAISAIPDGSEFLISETVRKAHGTSSWFHHAAGNSRKELTEELVGLKGSPVAVGLYPPWLNDSEDVISAVVPDEHGAVTPGAY